MGVAQALTAIVLGLTAPAASVPQTTDSSALQAVAAACAGARPPPATRIRSSRRCTAVSTSCGTRYRLGGVRGSGPLNRSSLIKANAVRHCGFTHTPCGMSFTRTFQRAGYLPARAFGENLAWGQADLGSPLHTLGHLAEVTAASREPPRPALAGSRHRGRARPHVRPRRGFALGDAVRPASPLTVFD